ncbi:MAG: hypothetical protein GC137_02975 [Alphaproteobacteria bacterium]|nr:hypothetical protein [Alphaproteobacteria bacterium]
MDNAARKIEPSEEIATRPSLLAWSLANFHGTPHERHFSFKGDISEWARQKRPKRIPSNDTLSEAEKLVSSKAAAPGFNYSATAAEYYTTLIETEPDPGVDTYQSITMMLMNGCQSRHYHPSYDARYGRAMSGKAERIMFIIPCSNDAEDQRDGIRVSLFNVKDPYISADTGKVKGTIVTPQYELECEPGHIVLARFRGDAPHMVEGNGIILSYHPLDVGAANRGNTYDANTHTWDGKKDLPEEDRERVIVYSGGTVREPEFSSLLDIYNGAVRHGLRFLERVKGGNPLDPVSRRQLKDFRSKLRTLMQQPPSHD